MARTTPQPTLKTLPKRKVTAPSPVLDTFKSPRPGRPFEITFETEEFTCLCPMTGQPDFAHLRITYMPDQLCVELKSLKLYLWHYRDRGAFHEAVTNQILDDLVAAIAPTWLRVEGDFLIRGGIRTLVKAEHGEAPVSYRGAVPPLLLILVATAGTLGCDTEARRQRRAEEARRNQAWEEGQRREAETAPPTPEALEQVRAASGAFMAEHHPDLAVEGITLTPLTPNLFLVGVAVHDPIHENRYVAQLSAERLRDGDWDGDFKENGRLLWVVDYADAERMRQLAQRHGFGPEVDRIRDQDPGYRTRASWGRRTWLDDYLLWHFLFHRPASYGWHPGGSYAPMAPGFRMQDPGHPIAAEDAARFQSAAAPTNGRSMVFLGGSAWRPPLISSVGSLPGQAYVAGPHGSISGTAAKGSVGRGGFGAAGHAAGSGGHGSAAGG